MIPALSTDDGAISVRDIVKHGLPAGTTIVAGESGANREVTWAMRLRSTPPAFAHISGGEIILLPDGVLDLIDERLSLADAIRQLSTFGVAALAVATMPDPAACLAADAAAIPLLVLPHNVDFSYLERETSRTIAEQRRVLQQQNQDLGRQLMELAISGDTLENLCFELARVSDRAIAIERRDGGMIAFCPDPAGVIDEETTLKILDHTNTPAHAWLRTHGIASIVEPSARTWSTSDGWLRIVAPVSSRDGLLGSVSLIIRKDEERSADTLFASRAATALAVALSREQAAASARREVELNVLDEMLDGALRSEISLSQQAQRLGHDLNQTFCTLNARIDPAPGGPARSREGRWAVLEEGIRDAQRALHLRLLWRVRNTGAEIVWATASAGSPSDVANTVHTALEHTLHAQGSSEVISIGVGRPGHGIQGMRQSYQEARQALTLGRRLQRSGQITDFDTLGIYRLILAAEHMPELHVFQEETLGVLTTHDQVHKSNLTETLEAFFAANCSPKETASILKVHRNTVLYRLDRIAEVTGLDLDNPDTRLRLHLALHVRTALGTSHEGTHATGRNANRKMQ